jgi:tRNA1(Val) A37 N6-methylase TrmN6
MVKSMINPETYELIGGVKVHISKEHRFGTDSLLLGEFAKKSSLKNKTVVDLCSGCGIVPAVLTVSENSGKLYAVEIQKEAVDLIKKIELDINVIEGDLRDEKVLSQIGREVVDLVTANPPYFPKESGFEREASSQKTARYDGEGCTLTDVVRSAAYLLKFGGELKLCMTASRLAETISIMQSFSIEPKEIQFVGRGDPDKQARLFLISGKKGAKSGVVILWK